MLKFLGGYSTLQYTNNKCFRLNVSMGNVKSRRQLLICSRLVKKLQQVWPNRSFISVSIKKCTNSAKWKPFLKAWLISQRSNNFRRLNPFDCMFLSCPRTPFQSESTLYSCLNVKELLARSRRKIWNLSDRNWTRTQNHLVHKRTLNYLAKLACRLRTKWFWVQVQLQSLNTNRFYIFQERSR